MACPDPVVSEAKEIASLRVVAHGLGQFASWPRLKDNLKLVLDPATVALREQLPLRIDVLAEGNIDSAALAQCEIAKATKALAAGNAGHTIGAIAGWPARLLRVVKRMLGLSPAVIQKLVRDTKIGKLDRLDAEEP